MGIASPRAGPTRGRTTLHRWLPMCCCSVLDVNAQSRGRGTVACYFTGHSWAEVSRRGASDGFVSRIALEVGANGRAWLQGQDFDRPVGGWPDFERTACPSLCDRID